VAVVTVSSVAEVVDILMAALGPAVDLSPKHPWFSNTCGTVYITTSLTYSLFFEGHPHAKYRLGRTGI